MKKYVNNELTYSPKCSRHTTRFSNEMISYPEVAYTVQKRIEKHFNISENYRTIFANNQGIYSGLSEPYGGYYKSHTDPIYIEGTQTVHCNIVVTNNIGGEIELCDETIEMKRGMLIAYPVSDLQHKVMNVRDNTFRNLWVFGYSIPRNETFFK